MSPPERKRRPPAEAPFRDYSDATDSSGLPVPYAGVATWWRRSYASARMAPLDSGRADPWHYDDEPVSGYEAAAAHLLGHGLTPAPNREGLRRMWKCGGYRRLDAETIAARWGLAS